MHFFSSPAWRSKPKSWQVSTLATASVFLVAMPLLVLGNSWDWVLLEGLGLILFVLAWLVMVAMGIVHLIAWFQGRYQHMQDLPWEKQVW